MKTREELKNGMFDKIKGTTECYMAIYVYHVEGTKLMSSLITVNNDTMKVVV